MTDEPEGIADRVYWRGDPAYEQARLDAVWHGRKPNRHPDGILVAESEQEVIDAVKLASARGLRVKARAGGHSWTASSVRDDGLLINLSQLTELSIDAENGQATVQPGCKGRELNRLLAEHDLFFPTGHCPTIAVGGFLLQGGWGWLSRQLGPACMSVVGVDVVTADGTLVHADEHENSELLWAARGAGSGFFGIVTRYYLRCHPRPASFKMSTYVYPRSSMEEVVRWAAELQPEWPDDLEIQLFGGYPQDPPGTPVEGADPVVIVIGFALCASEEDADRGLAMLDACPARDTAVLAQVAVDSTLAALYDYVDIVVRPEDSSAGDSLWTDADPDEIVAAFLHMVDTLPTPLSYVLCWPWVPRPLEGSALSIVGKHYLSPFAVWTDPADEARYSDWPADEVRRVDHLSKGIQLADENLLGRPDSRYLSDANGARLEELRERWDPDGRFHTFLFGDAR